MENTKGNVKKYVKRKGYESLNRDMLQDENNLSLEAIGLLSNLTSYPDTWELYKTELYKRFKKTGRRKVEKAWDNLVEEKYIVQLRRRNGKKYDYIYYYSQERFSDEEINQITKDEGAEIWDGTLNGKKNNDTKGKQENPHSDNDSSNVHPEQSKKSDPSTVHPEQSKMDSPKRTANRSTMYEVHYKDKEDIKEDTYKDTENPDLSTSNNNQTLANKSEKEKEEIYKQTLKDKIPDNIFRTLSVLSQDYDEMYKWYGIILRAKDSVQKERNTLIYLDEEQIDMTIDQALQKGIRVIKKQKKDSPDNYLYVTMRNTFADLFESNLLV